MGGLGPQRLQQEIVNLKLDMTQCHVKESARPIYTKKGGDIATWEKISRTASAG
ncbi:hypothetical protein MAALD49_10140 [Marinobacter shengliensis]|uniref:Uncharacterized protein n=1 Tax=Marinobacter nauticus TaxID=2743 RepID=A0A455W2Q5_MARNT|nr:hypothetical protein YBY_09090 [Marinobacter nauticus]BEH13646.1 hypothetical protein MAALD49_10140 [Marinobacter shengliensis]